MKIVVACDSYKGCMTPQEVCEQVKKGILRANPSHEVRLVPMADGGESTAQVFGSVLGMKMETVTTKDAYGKKIEVAYAWDGSTAVIDVASCIGLNMVPKPERNPMIANSRGVAIMMKDAIQKGCERLIIGLGGSSTNDGGMGILEEFGVEFYDQKRHRLEPSMYALSRIAYVNKRKFQAPKGIEIIAACDVQNHLLGKEGATFIFGGQKGIFYNQMEEIDGWMERYRDKLKQTFHTDIDKNPGSGAAGGIGGLLMGVFHAHMVPGIELLMDYANMDAIVEECDLVITGEGQTDAQTMFGKVPYGVLQVANRHHKPTICLSGALQKGYENLYEEGMLGIFSTADRAMSFPQALKLGPEKLEALAFSVTKLLDGWKEVVR